MPLLAGPAVDQDVEPSFRIILIATSTNGGISSKHKTAHDATISRIIQPRASQCTRRNELLRITAPTQTLSVRSRRLSARKRRRTSCALV